MFANTQWRPIQPSMPPLPVYLFLLSGLISWLVNYGHISNLSAQPINELGS